MSDPTQSNDGDHPEISDLGASPAPTADRHGRNRRRSLLVGGITVAGVAVVVATTLLVANFFLPTTIERAGEACEGSKPFQAFVNEVESSAPPESKDDEPEESDSEFEKLFEGVVSVEDNGRTLIVNTKPQDDDVLGLTSLSLDCVYEQLVVPSYISELIGQTRGLDGRQSGEWDGFSASWGYHPDSGANLIIVQN